MNVMVTGATGFVGGHLVDRLLHRGDTVTALVRSAARAAPLAARGVRLVVGDLASDAAMQTAVTGQDVIQHLAGQLGASTEAPLLAANRDGTRRLADACIRGGVAPRFVLLSSMAAGGPAQHGAPKLAAGDDHPVTMYGRSKLAGERVLSSFALPWVVIRAPAVYGPRDHDGFLPLFRATRFGLAPTFGDGAMEISLVHVVDLVDALILAGTVPGIEGRIFYVNHPEIITGAAVARTIAAVMHRTTLPLPIPEWAARVVLGVTGTMARLTGHATILHPDKIHEFYQDAWTADPSPFIAATGWRPAFASAAGFADTAAAYRAVHWI